MNTNTKLAEALRRLVNTFPIPVDGVEQADRASLRLALFTAREALAAHDAEQAQEPVAWMSPGKERLEFSRPDTVYGSHTIPLYAAPTEQAAQAVPAASAETPRRRIDPMQNPFRPGYYMNYQQGETPAESVLRKLACWLGAGGYNDEKLDADLMHRKIVAAIQDLAAAPAAPAPEAPSSGVSEDYRRGYEDAMSDRAKVEKACYPLVSRWAANRTSVWVQFDDGADEQKFVLAPQAQAAGQELPPLPEPNEPAVFGYTSADMKAYARAAVSAAMARRQPLTEQQIMDGWRDECPPSASLDVFTDGVVFAERAHGIGEATTGEQQR